MFPQTCGKSQLHFWKIGFLTEIEEKKYQYDVKTSYHSKKGCLCIRAGCRAKDAQMPIPKAGCYRITSNNEGSDPVFYSQVSTESHNSPVDGQGRLSPFIQRKKLMWFTSTALTSTITATSTGSQNQLLSQAGLFTFLLLQVQLLSQHQCEMDTCFLENVIKLHLRNIYC